MKEKLDSTKTVPIVIKSIEEEYEIINEMFGHDWKLEKQLLKMDGDPVDIFTIILSDGTKKNIYFDISSFYGKY